MGVDAGTLAKLGIHTTTPVTAAFDFVSESLMLDESIINANGIRGTRDESTERFRPGNIVVGGSLSLRPTPVELALLLPWMLGGTTSGSGTVTYNIGETLTQRFVVIDRVSKVYTYAGCAVDGFTIRARQGEAMELELRLVGQTETVGNAGTFPALNLDVTTAPFVFSDLVFTLNSTTLTFPEVEFSMENMIDRDRYMNSRTLTATVPMDRKNSLKTRVPTGDHQALYNAGLSQSGVNAGVSASLVFTNGGSVFTITMPKVTFPRKSPNVGGKNEIFMPIEAIPAKSGTGTPSVTMTLAPGP